MENSKNMVPGYLENLTSEEPHEHNVLPKEPVQVGTRVPEGRGKSRRAHHDAPLRGVPSAALVEDRYIRGICFHFALCSYIPRQVKRACSSNLQRERARTWRQEMILLS